MCRLRYSICTPLSWCLLTKISPFPTCLGRSHFNFSLHFSILECYLPHKIVFYDCLDQQRIWVVPALSLLDPRAEQLQNLISLLVMNSLISFVCNTGWLTPTLKEMRADLFKEWIWSSLIPERLQEIEVVRVSPPGFYKGKATQSGRDLTVLSIKDAASKPHSLQLISRRDLA